jgi:NAD(P)-dependent dehydrogenase (short-subunit alcohol dehydrogenase family)
MFNLTGKVALVTGASQGIGRATALALLGAGARVALCARNAEKLGAIEAEVTAVGAEALAVPMDVAGTSW